MSQNSIKLKMITTHKIDFLEFFNYNLTRVLTKKSISIIAKFKSNNVKKL